MPFLCSFLFRTHLVYISIFALYPAYTTHNLHGSTNLEVHHPLVSHMYLRSLFLLFAILQLTFYNDMTYLCNLFLLSAIS
jgi:hypothetical protein